MNPPAPFPFSAVVGQDDARLALLLAAVDPGIGGVLLRGDKGSAKSTLARGLAGLLPPGAPFVELPIGATEDRVVGGLDVGAALSGHAIQLRPGLLAAAHGGVLYVDEVNLLPDHLVDVLLDAAASGIHRVERDGVSHTHAARFVLIGSMNPEEGELRPQLLDRFGLAAEVRASGDPLVRAEVVKRRMRFERHEPLDHDDALLTARLAASRPAVLPDEVVDFACRLAVAGGAEGLRGDLVLCRAGAALAGWEGRSLTTVDDVERVASLALSHRRRRRPFDPPGFPPEELRDALDRARTDPAPADTSDEPGRSGGGEGSEDRTGAGEGGGGEGGGGESGGGERGAGRSGAGESGASRSGAGRSGAGESEAGRSGAGRSGAGESGAGRSGAGESGAGPSGDRPSRSQAVDGRWAELAGAALDFEPGRLRVPPPMRPAAPTTGPAARGPVIGARPPGANGPIGVAVAATLRAGMHRRGAHPDGPPVTAADLREPVRVEPRTRCIVLAVDTSSSMGSRTRAEAAAGAVLGLLADAYRRRHRVALVAFRGESAEVALAPTASVEIARARLADLPVGGATPLAEGLDLAHATARRAAADGDTPLLVVLTDARATAGPDALDRALVAAAAVASAGIQTLVLDAEDGATRLSLAPRLARALGGVCLPLADLSAPAVEAAIRSTLEARP